jgi:ABC-2 type transport system permease protein
LLAILGRLSPDYQSISRYTPFAYYQGGDALRGMNWTWWVGLMIAAVVMVVGAAFAFHRRDIRVFGEGGWTWTRRLRRRGAPPPSLPT